MTMAATATKEPTVAATMVPTGVPEEEAVSVAEVCPVEPSDAGVVDLTEDVVAAAACSVTLCSGGNVMVFPLDEEEEDDDDDEDEDPLPSQVHDGVGVGVAVGVASGASVAGASVGTVIMNT